MVTMSPQELFDAYHEMFDLSCKMNAAAQANLWDNFLYFEHQRSVVLDRLQQGNSLQVQLDENQRTELEAVCGLILEEDQKTLPLMRQWMSEISRMLQANQTENQLKRAYDPSAMDE